jgi:ABC-type Zn uptake system ZnuABC Zn-binding protein ZnuA
VFVKVGLDLEVWAQLLTDGARNAKIRPGAVGYVDASTGAEILELPTGKLDRSMGDIHAFGNPHYWLDPQNGKVVAHNIAEALKRVAPGDADVFDQNEKRFSAQLDEKLARWLQLMAPYQGTKVVTYHNSWPNFMHRFGLNVVDYLEPKPGVPPSPAHLASLIGKMNSEGVKVVIQEPYFDQKVGKFVAEKTGAKLLVLSPSVGGEEGINTYPDLFDRNLQKLLAAFKETGVEPKAPAEVKGGK